MGFVNISVRFFTDNAEKNISNRYEGISIQINIRLDCSLGSAVDESPVPSDVASDF